MRSVSPTRWIDLLALCLWSRVRVWLVQLIAPVYGLNDALLWWHRTLTAWLIKQGYRKSLLEPCLYVHYVPGGSVDGLILIEVDDLAIGIKRMQEAEFQQRFQTAFRFGKWEKREASFAGRRIRQRDQYVLVDQEKYIVEKLHPVLLREKQQKDRRLSLDEFNQLRSLVYKISWVAKESRLEASGSASILAQHLKAPTVSDVLIANRVVKFLRSSASQCLTIWRHDPKNLRVISVSDAGGIGGPPTENGENVQNAHLIMIADDGIRQGVHFKASTLAGETIAMSAALAGRCRVGTNHDSRYFGSDRDSARQDRRDASISGGSAQQLNSPSDCLTTIQSTRSQFSML